MNRAQNGALFVPALPCGRDFRGLAGHFGRSGRHYQVLNRGSGEYDHLPEAAFYMVGTIEDAISSEMAAEAAGGYFSDGRQLQFDLFRRNASYSERVDSVTIPGVEGDFGVSTTQPIMAMIREGELIVESDGAQRSFALAGGLPM